MPVIWYGPELENVRSQNGHLALTSSMVCLRISTCQSHFLHAIICSGKEQAASEIYLKKRTLVGLRFLYLLASSLSVGERGWVCFQKQVPADLVLRQKYIVFNLLRSWQG